MIGMGRDIQRTPQMAQTKKERWHDVNSRYDKWNISQHFKIFSCSSSKMIMKHFLEHLKLWRHHKQQKEFSSEQTKVLDGIIRRDYFV